MAIQCHSQNAAMKIGMWSVAVIVNTHYQFIVHDKGASLNSIVLLDKMDILGFSMHQTSKKTLFVCSLIGHLHLENRPALVHSKAVVP